jgi:radical SAM-linked protein
MAYSAGFSPHPKVSYAGAAPTGVASEAEYLEIGLAERCDPERLRTALDVSLPGDLDVLELVESRGGSLADRLQASVWEIRLDGVPLERAESAVAAFLAADRVEVSRMTKNGLRTFDAREAVLSLRTGPGGDDLTATPGTTLRDTPGASHQDDDRTCAILTVVVRHVTPAVRPDDVLTGLRLTGDLAPSVTPAVTRLAQGPYDEASGTVSDPLAPDRDDVGT